MSIRALLLAAGLLAAVAGVFLGGTEVSALNHIGGQVTCGSVFDPANLQAMETSESRADLESTLQGDEVDPSSQAQNAAACADALSTRRGWTLGVGIGGLLVVALVGLAHVTSRQAGPSTETPEKTPRPSSA